MHPVRAALIAPSDEARDLDTVAGALMVDSSGTLRRVIYTESHDEVANGSSRVPEVLAGLRRQLAVAKTRCARCRTGADGTRHPPMLFRARN